MGELQHQVLKESRSRGSVSQDECMCACVRVERVELSLVRWKEKQKLQFDFFGVGGAQMQEIRNSLTPCRSAVSNPAVGLWAFQKSSAATDCLASYEFREEMDLFFFFFF